jgi:transposase
MEWTHPLLIGLAMGQDVVATTHQKEEGSTMKITTVGLDIAKSVFHFVGVNKAGKLVKKKMIKRKDLIHFFAQVEPCLVVMEACGGANYWAREFQKVGHEVKLIASQYVIPYRPGNKNDYNDALAIAEAAQRPNMRFVRPKPIEQQMFKCFTGCGLVPKQHSSGGKDNLLGISKRGNAYLRTLFIHGARAVLRHSDGKVDRLSRWAIALVERRGFNRACVAVANKLALWRLEEEYQMAI